jgi:hypothetical protein
MASFSSSATTMTRSGAPVQGACGDGKTVTSAEFAPAFGPCRPHCTKPNQKGQVSGVDSNFADRRGHKRALSIGKRYP